uniref:Rho guanine nucleotide exchange factor 6/7 coiled-coil domain-containing protein n=2 Tax=Graphocephala atropunctata TaxID=36148 RepID=A0A1B6MTI6_9HEMI
MVRGSNIGRPWSVSCLRPSPPLRFRDDKSSRNFKKTSERGFDEDAQILRVIEAYCTSAKTRYTVNSALLDPPPLLIAEEEKIIEEDSRENQTGVQEKSLVDTVYALKDEVKALRYKMSSVSHQLEEERMARNQLQTVVHNLLMASSHT